MIIKLIQSRVAVKCTVFVVHSFFVFNVVHYLFPNVVTLLFVNLFSMCWK